MGGLAGELGAGILEEPYFRFADGRSGSRPRAGDAGHRVARPEPSRVNQPSTANDSISLAASSPDKPSSDLCLPNFQQQRFAGRLFRRFRWKRKTPSDAQLLVGRASDQAIQFRAQKLSFHVCLGGLPEERQRGSLENAPLDECLQRLRAGRSSSILTSAEMRDAKSLAVAALSVAALIFHRFEPHRAGQHEAEDVEVEARQAGIQIQNRAAEAFPRGKVERLRDDGRLRARKAFGNAETCCS